MIGKIARLLPLPALLWVLFLPGLDGEGHRLRLDYWPRPEMMLVLCLLAALAWFGVTLPRAWRWSAAVGLMLAAVIGFADAVVVAFFDRDLALYFDLPHVPKLVALFAESAGWGWAWGAFLALTLVLAALLAILAWSMGAASRVLTGKSQAGLVLAAFAAAAAAMFAIGEARVAPVLFRQLAGTWRAFAVFHGLDPTYATRLAAPVLPAGPLPGLKHQDVLLVFFESYGTVVLDDPRFAPQMMPALAAFAQRLEGAGYHLKSNRVVSPTFGGGSWLAHGTVASGLKLDRFLDRLLVESNRPTLPKYMAAAGYRTVDIMPGIKKSWPEAGFWGFDKTYYSFDLAYEGPEFGWFDIPDQFTLRRFEASEGTPGHAPLFAELVLVSSHTPFLPVPPYVEDWNDAGDYKSVSEAEWKTIYHEPDWEHLEVPYVESVLYDLRTISEWLARRDGNALVIILGDHQPPGFISGEHQPWTVPIHVLSRDPDLVQPFARHGFVDGVVPPLVASGAGMESFLGAFLADFSRPPARLASRP